MTVSLQGGSFSSGTTTGSTNGSGIASFSDLVIETAGSYSLEFDVNASGVPSQTSTSFDVTAAAASAIEEVDGSGQTQEVNTQLTTPFEVRVVDNFGNAIAGEDVSFAISGTPDGATGQSITNLTATSDANGLVSTTLTLGDTAGAYSVDASFNGVIVTFTAEATNPI